jgi:hypothetical protein
MKRRNVQLASTTLTSGWTTSSFSLSFGGTRISREFRHAGTGTDDFLPCPPFKPEAAPFPSAPNPFFDLSLAGVDVESAVVAPAPAIEATGTEGTEGGKNTPVLGLFGILLSLIDESKFVFWGEGEFFAETGASAGIGIDVDRERGGERRRGRKDDAMRRLLVLVGEWALSRLVLGVV